MKRAACVLFVNDAGQVLTISRRGIPESVGIPGGKVDSYPRVESELDAAYREIWEELGIRRSAHTLIPVYVGACDDFWVTTFLSSLQPSIKALEVEEGMVASWTDISALLSTDLLEDGSPKSPFQDYNRRLFENSQVLNSLRSKL